MRAYENTTRRGLAICADRLFVTIGCLMVALAIWTVAYRQFATPPKEFHSLVGLGDGDAWLGVMWATAIGGGTEAQRETFFLLPLWCHVFLQVFAITGFAAVLLLIYVVREQPTHGKHARDD